MNPTHQSFGGPNRATSDLFLQTEGALPAEIGHEQLRDALLEMEGLEQLVLALYYLDSLSLPDVARVLELPELLATQIYTHAMAQLRGKLRSRQRSAA